MRSALFLATLAVGFTVFFGDASAHAICFDLTKSEPHALSGILSRRVFPGPPGWKDIRNGDTPIPGYVLILPRPICLTGNAFADPNTPFSEVQLIASDKTAKAMRSSDNRNVAVILSGSMAAENGYHFRPLVGWVEAISQVNDGANENGAAAKAVRTFYHAFAKGDGTEASKLIVPESRQGALSADQMTRFYGRLTRPLKLRDIVSAGPNAFLAHYQFQMVRYAAKAHPWSIR